MKDRRQSDAERHYAEIKKEMTEDGFLSGEARETIGRELAALQESVIGLATVARQCERNLWRGRVYDYTGLLLWGLTADVVSHSLSNLPARLGDSLSQK